MEKRHQRTTTFPLEWSKIKRLESQLLMTFLDTEREKDAINLLMITLGARFGLRVSDLLSLRWSDLEIPSGDDLVIKEKKTAKLRILRITSRLKTVANQVIRILTPHPSHFIFTSTHRNGLAPMTVQNFNVRLKKILKLHGIRAKGCCVARPLTQPVARKVTLRVPSGRRIAGRPFRSQRAPGAERGNGVLRILGKGQFWPSWPD